MARTTTKKRSNNTKKFKPSNRVMALLLVLLITAVGTTIVFGASAARNPSYTTTVKPVLVKDVNADGIINFGDIITLNITTNATGVLWMVVRCYQGGVAVAAGINGYPNSSATWNMYSGMWTSGAASCEAHLMGETKNHRSLYDIAVQNFTVAP